MNNNLQKILAAIQVLAAFILVGATRIWAPVCQKKLELVNGKKVPMRCFYTDRTTMVLAGLVILIAILIFIAKKEVKKFYFLNLVLAVLIFLTYTTIIGVCMNHEMSCNTTALWGKASAAIVGLSSLIGLLSGKEGQVPQM